MSTGTCGRIKNCCISEKNFQKNNYHLYSGPNFVFCETAFGSFSQCFAFIFLSSVNHGDRHFNSVPPTIKKLPTARKEDQ